MNPNLFIRFKGVDQQDDSQVDLAELGESLVGFDSVIKEFARILRVEGGVEVKATAQREGSIIVDIVLWVNNATPVPPFASVGDFLEFLRITGDPLWNSASTFFNSLEGAHATVNDWASRKPIDFAVLTGLVGMAIKALWDKAKKNKNGPDYSDANLPKRVADELHRLIKKKGFNRALKPIVEDKVDSVEVSNDRGFRNTQIVDSSNFHEYLPENAQILPSLLNGDKWRFNGKVTSLKSTRGDSLTLQTEIEEQTIYFEVFPADGKTSKHYKDYYQEEVHIYVEIIRASPYKKPKLKLLEIGLSQGKFDLEIPSSENITEQEK